MRIASLRTSSGVRQIKTDAILKLVKEVFTLNSPTTTQRCVLIKK